MLFFLSTKKALMRDHRFVLFLADQPENVRLITNTTSKLCTGDIINFTCTAKANPVVHTYLLYENDTVIKNLGISGILVKTIENAGKFVFRCEANNSIRGSGASNKTVFTVDGKVHFLYFICRTINYFKSHIEAISHKQIN